MSRPCNRRLLPTRGMCSVALLSLLAACGAHTASSRPAAPGQPPSSAAPPSARPQHTSASTNTPPPTAPPPTAPPPTAPPPTAPRALSVAADVVTADAQRDDEDTLWLTSIRYKTWIWEKPNRGGRYLGFMRIGQRLATRQHDKVVGMGCAKGYFAVRPRGYVCDDRTVTTKEQTPFLKANAFTLPKDGPLPYRYAISNGAPMYTRLPNADEQRRMEARYGKVGNWVPLPPFSRGHEHLAVTTPIAPDGAIPGFLAAGEGARGKPLVLFRRSLPHGSMMAFRRSFDVGGRTFLLSNDLTVVPADRVRQFRASTFAGVRLSKAQRLPLAWVRAQPRTQYRWKDGGMHKTDVSFPVRSHHFLTGRQREVAGSLFHEVSPAGSERYIAAQDATIVRQRERIPYGVRQGEKWVIISIRQGTLVAYQNLKPIFTTLVSPGSGGVPHKGGDPVKDSTTPLGAYRITFKDLAATMSPEMGANRSFWIADVPHTQYFNAPFALHGAYWHEKFGEPMSAGCVNLSPRDAHWLFGWSDPQLPPGWQGITGAKGNGATTAVIVTR